MPVVLKRAPPASTVANAALKHVGWFCAAGLFVAILALTYGLDLSPGLF